MQCRPRDYRSGGSGDENGIKFSLAARPRGRKQREIEYAYIFISFVCACSLALAIKLNFNISKVVYRVYIYKRSTKIEGRNSDIRS